MGYTVIKVYTPAASFEIGALTALSKSKKHFVGLNWANGDSTEALARRCSQTIIAVRLCIAAVVIQDHLERARCAAHMEGRNDDYHRGYGSTNQDL
jgi:hypothetical protein